MTPTVGFSQPSQPPLLPSSQPPERLRFMEKEGSPEASRRRTRSEPNQGWWLLAILGVFLAVVGAIVLVGWLLGR